MSKAKIAAVLVVLVAFLWGYRGETLVGRLQRAGGVAAGVDAKKEPGTSSSRVSAEGVRGVPSAPNQEGIRKTLEAITPLEPNPEAEEKRNRYLENLTNQLHELQGEAPPAAPAPAVPPPVVAVPSGDGEITEEEEEGGEEEEIVEDEEDEVIDEETEDEDLEVEEGSAEDPLADELIKFDSVEP